MRRNSTGFWILVLSVIALGGFSTSSLIYDGSPLIGSSLALVICIPILALERSSAFPALHRWFTSLNSVQFWSLALSIAAAGGLTFAVLAAKDSLVASAFFGICLSVPIFAFERGVILRKLHLWINRLPTFGFILAGLSVYYILINIGFAIAGTAMWSIGLMGGSFTEATIIPPNILLYTLGVSAMLTFILRVRELLGRDIFASLIVGRYRQPVSENRVFLFIDLVGSTSYAEQYGDLRAQQFLSALFATFSEPVRRHRGTIDDYLGDAVLITWPYEKGIRDARCVRCVFDILDVIAANSAKWMREFGQVPSLRAALHGGPVITAEIGVDHHKITYFGDTVNTTARLEGLCRTLSANVLISGELALRINFPPEIAREQLGTHNVKGKGQPLAVVALKRQAPQQNADFVVTKCPVSNTFGNCTFKNVYSKLKFFVRDC